MNKNPKITNPGKFEGEKESTQYYYGLLLDGMGDILEFNDGEVITVFEVTTEEKDKYGLIEPYYAIREDSNGFKYGIELEATLYQDIQEEYENQEQ